MKPIFSLLLFLTLSSTVEAQRFKLPKEIMEASGLAIVKDTLYWINDSGSPATVFATYGKGKLLNEFEIKATNVDWEDLTVDEEGRIYIADFGNNKNQRKEFQIYRWDKVENLVDTFRYFYGPQKEFPPAKGYKIYDAEGMVYTKDTIHVFSKSKMGNEDLNIYRYTMPLKDGLHELYPQDTFNMGEWLVTAAAIHPEKKVLALLSYRYLLPRFWFPSSEILLTIFYDYPENDFFKGKVITRRIPSWFFASQYECIDWLDNERLLIGSERTAFIRQKAKVVKLKSKELEILKLN